TGILSFKEKYSVVTQFIGEEVYPSSSFHVQEISGVLVDVNSINATSDQSILVGVKGLKMFSAAVWR
ncbi:MAG: hypothetical protein ACKPKO_36960, partial [Candidatus Fonsibacter sp.]